MVLDHPAYLVDGERRPDTWVASVVGCSPHTAKRHREAYATEHGGQRQEQLTLTRSDGRGRRSLQSAKNAAPVLELDVALLSDLVPEGAAAGSTWTVAAPADFPPVAVFGEPAAARLADAERRGKPAQFRSTVLWRDQAWIAVAAGWRGAACTSLRVVRVVPQCPPPASGGFYHRREIRIRDGAAYLDERCALTVTWPEPAPAPAPDARNADLHTARAADGADALEPTLDEALARMAGDGPVYCSGCGRVESSPVRSGGPKGGAWVAAPHTFKGAPCPGVGQPCTVDPPSWGLARAVLPAPLSDEDRERVRASRRVVSLDPNLWGAAPHGSGGDACLVVSVDGDTAHVLVLEQVDAEAVPHPDSAGDWLGTLVRRGRHGSVWEVCARASATPLWGLDTAHPLDLVELADRELLRVAEEQGPDARPVPWMAGRDGRPCTWDPGTVEHVLWSLGAAELQRMIDAGLVQPAADTTVGDDLPERPHAPGSARTAPVPAGEAAVAGDASPVAPEADDAEPVEDAADRAAREWLEERAQAAMPALAGVELHHADVVDVLQDVNAANLVVVDPPWSYRSSGGRGAAANHYATLPVSVIADHMAWAAQSCAANAVLLLWVTGPLLEELFLEVAARRMVGVLAKNRDAAHGRVVEALMACDPKRAKGAVEPLARAAYGPGWPWSYKSLAVWAKPQIGTGHWVRSQAELLTVWTKGNPPVPPTALRPHGVHTESRLAHSAKPEGWYRDVLLPAYCPAGGVVFEPYAGLGGLARACIASGRRYVGAEIDADRWNQAAESLCTAQLEDRNGRSVAVAPLEGCP